jgi:anti-sigma factor RsiW
MDKMDKERWFIHELLDGELSPEDRRVLLDRMDSDPLLKKEFDDLRSVVDMVEKGERLTVPAAFTSEVMRRLPARKESFGKKVSSFLFGQRVLRWDVATALAAAVLVIMITGGLYQIRNKDTVVSYQRPADGASRTVAIRFYAPKARSVSLAGDFNKWSAEKGLMKKESDGIWTLEIPLQPGTYHYMFVVDGEAWVMDPNAELYREDGFGKMNSVLRVSL